MRHLHTRHGLACARIRTGTKRLRSQEGFTLIEVLAAMLVLTVGVVGLIATFDGARKLTLVSERQASAAHRAQWEIEKLQAEPYSELAMISAPSHSSESTNPDYYVNYNSPVKCTSEGAGCYAANTEKLGEEETLVAATEGSCVSKPKTGCGVVSASPSGHACSENPVGSCEWKDGLISGAVYDFVTWHSDVVCEKEEGGKKICTAKSYKSIVVIATVNVPSTSATHPQVRVSTLIADPSSVPEGSVINGKQNPLENPSTKCGTESCINGAQAGNPQSWYVHDAPASAGSPPTAPSANHTTHATVASSGECTEAKTGGCPKPDLMDGNAPSATKLFFYSTDQGETGYIGGRIVKTDVECSGEPSSTDNTKGELWVTPALSAETKLTGYGGMSLYTQTLNNVSAVVTLCVAVYDVSSITNMVKTKPTKLGYASYTPATWPTTMTELSFEFKFLSSGTVTLAKEHRVGVRIWPAASSASAIAIAYDTTGGSEVIEGKTVEKSGYSSLLQLNTE
jgi:prepilin-type N-terminal cleavage/methylation domain-containing protein